MCGRHVPLFVFTAGGPAVSRLPSPAPPAPADESVRTKGVVEL